MTAVAAATTGACFAYVFLATPSQQVSQQSSRPALFPRRLAPPPELPSSSKLLIPNIDLNFELGPPDQPVDVRARCDYGPLWECVVNGNGGCEALEKDLRNCLERAGESSSEPPDTSPNSQCDYAPLWECIVNGNGGCEALEEDFRICLERSKRNPSRRS